MSTVEDRFNRVRSFLEAHNQAIGEGLPGFVPVDDFLRTLRSIGATTEQALLDVSYEDLLACLPGGTVTPPRLLAKQIARILRDDGRDARAGKRPITAYRAEAMTATELIDRFDPDDPDNAVGKRLRDLSRGQPFLVYHRQDNALATTHSEKLLAELRQGYHPRKDYELDGDVTRVYAVGDRPDRFGDENPLYPGRLLRPDQTCDQTGRSWDGVSLAIRQFLRVVVETKQGTLDIDAAHDLIDQAIRPNAMADLRKRYRNESLAHDARQDLGQLPTLRLPLPTEYDATAEPNRSMAAGKPVKWPGK